MALAVAGRAHVERVEEAVEAKDFETALGHLEALAEATPTHSPVLDYYRAVCFRGIGEIDRAIEHFDRCGLAPPPPNKRYFIFDNYLSWLRKFESSRLQAVRRGMPFFCIASLPQSAGRFFCNRLSRITGCELANPFEGAPYSIKESWTTATWVSSAALGGMISHSHFAPAPGVLDLLSANDVRRILVQVRDPRQSLYSRYMVLSKKIAAGQAGKRYEVEGEALLEQLYRATLPKYWAWLRGWIEVGRRRSDLEVKFVDFPEVTRDSERVIAETVAFFGVDPDALELSSAETAGGTGEHFRKGAVDEWRSAVPERLLPAIDASLDGEVADFFGWPGATTAS